MMDTRNSAAERAEELNVIRKFQKWNNREIDFSKAEENEILSKFRELVDREVAYRLAPWSSPEEAEVYEQDVVSDFADPDYLANAEAYQTAMNSLSPEARIRATWSGLAELAKEDQKSVFEKIYRRNGNHF